MVIFNDNWFKFCWNGSHNSCYESVNSHILINTIICIGPPLNLKKGEGMIFFSGTGGGYEIFQCSESTQIWHLKVHCTTYIAI